MTVGIILLGGKGKRLSSDIPKQFLKVDNKMICEYTLDKFEESSYIDEICISCIDGYDEIYDYLLKKYKKIKYVTKGGKERQNSIFNALSILDGEIVKKVIIHDGARPFVTLDEIKDVSLAAQTYGASTTALPVVDTIKKVKNSLVEETIDRSCLVNIKTPQAFSYNLIMEAHIKALEDNFLATDDCGLVERIGKDVYIVNASPHNIKITTSLDLIIMESIIKDKK